MLAHGHQLQSARPAGRAAEFGSFDDRNSTMSPTQIRSIGYWILSLTLIFEMATVACRILTGSAGEFNQRNPPLLLQIHHMFWSMPFLVALPFIWSIARIRNPIAGIAFGLIVSDLLHHFLVLPLWIGNSGWHWP